MKNIAIFGIMASGKTSGGKLLAKKLGYRFYDTDELIVKRAGMPISNIFEKKGEKSFRRLESSVINALSKKKKCVIALGGGAITVPKNIKALKKSSMVVSLMSSVSAIMRRTAKDSSRPLLNVANRRKKIQELIRKRKALYVKHADLVIDTSKLTPVQIAEKIKTFLLSK